MYLIGREPLGFHFCQVAHSLDGTARIDCLFPLDGIADLNEAL